MEVIRMLVSVKFFGTEIEESVTDISYQIFHRFRCDRPIESA